MSHDPCFIGCSLNVFSIAILFLFVIVIVFLFFTIILQHRQFPPSSLALLFLPHSNASLPPPAALTDPDMFSISSILFRSLWHGTICFQFVFSDKLCFYLRNYKPSLSNQGCVSSSAKDDFPMEEQRILKKESWF